MTEGHSYCVCVRVTSGVSSLIISTEADQSELMVEEPSPIALTRKVWGPAATADISYEAPSATPFSV